MLTKYCRLGASSRLRSYQYRELLESSGYEVVISPLFNEKYLYDLYNANSRDRLNLVKCLIRRIVILFEVRKYSVIWIEKELFPYFPAYFEYVLRLLGVKYFVDYDDAIFDNYNRSSKYYIRFLLGGKIGNVMRYAETVVAGNAYLKSIAIDSGSCDVHIVPTVVDHKRYQKKVHNNKAKVCIGWIGSPSTQKYLYSLVPVFRALNEKHDLKLMFVGATEDVSSYFTGLDVDIVGWSEEKEAEQLLRFDIGVMPLDDTPWEKGKCGYKIIQYMASSLPVVVSDVGVNKSIVRKSVGFVASSNDEWYFQLDELISSHELRRKFGDAGRGLVRDSYSIDSQISGIKSMFDKAVLKKG